MTDHLQADGSARGKASAQPSVTVASLRPALASIPVACQYLGDPSRAKFYADILPKLDVVKLGARTFVTIDSLDRLIETNKLAQAEAPGRHRRAVTVA
jgi:hypothetical protein